MKKALILIFTCGSTIAGPLDDFKQLPSRSEKEVFIAADSSCRKAIAARTGTANVRVYGPCQQNDGAWSGIVRSGTSLKLTFNVYSNDEDSQRGTIWKAIRGKNVRVICNTDASGRALTLLDGKIGVAETIKQPQLCSPI